jgi:hypothetical protein
MTVNAAEPTVGSLGSDLVTLLQEERGEINSLWTAIGALGGATSYEAISATAGAITVALGGAGMIHVVSLGAVGAASIATITAGDNGQLLLLHSTGANVTLVHGDTTIHLSGAADFVMANHDFIMLLNLSGDSDAVPAVNGTWYEVFRTVHV